MSELKITQEKVTAAFSEANDCPKAISILTALFGKQKPDYTDYHNIKTYEDACEAIGVKPIVRLLVEDEDGHKEEVAEYCTPRLHQTMHNCSCIEQRS